MYLFFNDKLSLLNSSQIYYLCEKVVIKLIIDTVNTVKLLWHNQHCIKQYMKNWLLEYIWQENTISVFMLQHLMF